MVVKPKSQILLYGHHLWRDGRSLHLQTIITVQSFAPTAMAHSTIWNCKRVWE